MRTSLLLLALAACTVGGCDVFRGDSETAVYGRVVDATSGDPLEGFRVAFISSGGFGAHTTDAFTTTNADGRYRLSFSHRGGSWPVVEVNRLGTMERRCYYVTHSTASEHVAPGRRTRVDVRLLRNPYYDPHDTLSYPTPVRCITDFT